MMMMPTKTMLVIEVGSLILLQDEMPNIKEEEVDSILIVSIEVDDNNESPLGMMV